MIGNLKWSNERIGVKLAIFCVRMLWMFAKRIWYHMLWLDTNEREFNDSIVEMWDGWLDIIILFWIRHDRIMFVRSVAVFAIRIVNNTAAHVRYPNMHHSPLLISHHFMQRNQSKNKRNLSLVRHFSWISKMWRFQSIRMWRNIPKISPKIDAFSSSSRL